MPTTVLDYYEMGIRTGEYYQSNNNRYYCEMRIDDESHSAERIGTTDVYWKNDSAEGPRFICDLCYSALAVIEGEAPRKPALYGTRVLIKRRVPGCESCQ